MGSIGLMAVAVSVMAVSGANFTSTTANPNNQVTAGNLSHSNSKDGAAILTVDKLRPGQSGTGTVDIKNTGDIDGVFTLSKSNLVDAPVAPAFSSKLDLKIEDCGAPAAGCASPVTKYDGKLGAMGTIAMGTYAVDEEHRYRFTATFPDGGPNGADNAYKGASTTVQYDWESTNN